MPLSPEHTERVELESRVVEGFSATFLQRHDCYPRQLPQGSYVCVKQPLTTRLLHDHLLGKVTLGAYALNTQSMAQWLCLDADAETQWAELLKLAGFLATEGVAAYLETSRRGGHLWLFTPPLTGSDIRRFGKQLVAAYSLSPSLELYPKQDQLKTGPGSLVRLPLGVHRKSSKRYPFIQLDGTPLAPTIREQVALLGNPHRVSPDFIEQVLAEIRHEEPETVEPPAIDHVVLAPADGKHLSERLKATISVWDFVSRYVDLDAQGRGFCPFHDVHHKSFGVHAKANYWHCWAGCGGGSIIDFWMKLRAARGLDDSFTPTITELAQLLFPR